MNKYEIIIITGAIAGIWNAFIIQTIWFYIYLKDRKKGKSK